MRPEWRRAALIVLGVLFARGSGVSTETLAAPRAVPVVAEGDRAIGAFAMESLTFATPAAGGHDLRVDWGAAENDVDLYLVAGDCPPGPLAAGACPMLAFSESPSAKPERLAVELPAGVYTLGVLSQNPRPEHLRWRVTTR